MDSQNGLLSSPIVGSTLSPNLNILSRYAGLSPPEPLETLKIPDSIDYESVTSDVHRDAARTFLVRARTSDAGDRPPEQQKRHLLHVASGINLKLNEQNWTFTKHEVGKAFNELLLGTSLPDVQIAHAVLSSAPNIDSLDELWEHFQNRKLQKRHWGFFLRSTSSNNGPSNWLETATSLGSIPYIYLMCQFGAGQNLLDQAFGIALARRDLFSMKVLLSFGACVLPMDKDSVRRFVSQDDADVIKLLLSASKGMNVEDWQYCLEANIERTPREICDTEILLQCIHHRPDIASGGYLLKAIDAKNIGTVAVLLSYLTTRAYMMPSNFSIQNFSATYFLSATGNQGEHEAIAIQLCARISGISDYKTRYTLCCLLDEAGLLRDVQALREEMSHSVVAKRTSMINLLIKAGVRPSIENAVSVMDFSILELMTSTSIRAEDVPSLLSLVPYDTSEDDMLLFLHMFAAKNLNFGGQPLDQKLIEAISKRHYLAAATFRNMGANITYKSIRLVLDSLDVEMLKILLQGDMSNDELSPALSDAMKITDQGARRLVVKMLADKDVCKEALLEKLCLMIQSPEPDLELLEVLLQYQLPVHGEDGRLNIFHLSIHKAPLPVIQLLWRSSPNTASLSEAMPKAFLRIEETGGNLTYNIIEFLLWNGARGKGLDKTLLIAAVSKSPRALDIVRLLVKNGADANYIQGSAYAAARNDYTRLEILCKTCPVKPAVAQSLLPSLLEASGSSTQMLELVFESAASDGSAISFALLPAFLKGHINMAAIVSCLMKYGLDTNLQAGIILQFAVEGGNVALLKILLSTYTTTASLRTAFTATKRINPREMRLDMMGLLLDKAGHAEIGQSEVLYDEILEALSKSGDDRGVKILLAHKPVVDCKSLVIAAACSTRSTTVLEILLSRQPRGESISKACIAAFKSPKLNPDQMKSALELLLDAKPGLTRDEMSNLLRYMVEQAGNSTILPQMLIERGAEVMEGDLKAALATSSEELFKLLAGQVEPTSAVNEETIDVALTKLLLRHGADVKIKNFLPLRLSFKLESTEVAWLLIESITDDNAAAAAFDLVRASTTLKSAFRFKTYSSLLKHKISKERLNLALIDALKDGQDIYTVKLLLERGANPYKDGYKGFILACKTGNETALRVMCSVAYVDVVTLVLIEQCTEEKEVLPWLKVSMAESRKAHLKDSVLLYNAMTRFPSGGALVEKLLHYGMSPGTLELASLCKQWKLEPVTPLLWGLTSDLKISNRTLLALVARGDDANPLYSTPTSQVSAAFVCMLDPKRNPILEALLSLHGEEIKMSVIPGRSFSYLSQKPKTPDPTNLMTRDVPLSDAALYLGNLKAYISLGCGQDENNGSLHTAALLALPEFVRWLLQWHSANCELEAFGMMIPLVVACRSEARPWCRVANTEGTFEKRRLKTMQLLARKTDLSWRNRRKTVLHFAIDEGPDALQAMLQALDVAHDARRNERYLYTDREGILYSLSCYISHLLDTDNKQPEFQRMTKLLQGAGKLKDIMYQPKAPGPGVEQPEGYCGMPPGLQRKWDAHRAMSQGSGSTGEMRWDSSFTGSSY